MSCNPAASARRRAGGGRGRPVVLVGVVGSGAASFLPWAGSGTRLRNSYELVGVVDRLDLLPAALAGPSAAWAFLPLMVVLTCLAVVIRWTWCTTMSGLCVGVAVFGLAVAVVGSPLRVEPGAHIALVTGPLSVIGALMVLWAGRRVRRGG